MALGVRGPTDEAPPGLVLRFEDAAHQSELRGLETEAEFFVQTIFVPSAHRSLGVGSRLLTRLLFLADALGKPVRLQARPIGSSGTQATQRLVRWYRRFGFEVVDPAVSVPTLVRQPAAAPGPDAPR